MCDCGAGCPESLGDGGNRPRCAYFLFLISDLGEHLLQGIQIESGELLLEEADLVVG